VYKTWSVASCLETICTKFQLYIMLGWRAAAFWRRHPICNQRALLIARQLKLFIFDSPNSQFWFYSLVIKTRPVGTCLETICTKFQLSNMLFSIFLTPSNFSTAWGQIVRCLFNKIIKAQPYSIHLCKHLW